MRAFKVKLLAGAALTAFLVGYAPIAYTQGTKPTGSVAKPTGSAPKPAPPPSGSAKTTTGTGSTEDAKKHYQAGEAKFKAGDFANALTEFKAADEIKSVPQSQRYIGMCLDNLGRYVEAVVWYDKFTGAVPDKMQKEGDEIKSRSAAIKLMPGKVHVESTPPGATIIVDGKPGATTPGDVDLAPGHHTIRLDLAGYMASDKEVDVTYASKQDVKGDLTAKPAEPIASATPSASSADQQPPPAEPPPQRSLVPAFITGGLAVVALGLGIGFGAAALGKKSEYDQNPTESTANTGENFALVADMSFGVFITLGVTSAVLFLSKPDEPAKDAKTAHSNAPPKTTAASPVKITPYPIITPQGGGAGAMVRF